MSGVLSAFEIIEDEGDEFCAVLQRGDICASVERVGDMFAPAVSTNEHGENDIKGVPMSTAEHAAGAAILLVHILADRMKRDFPVPYGAQVIVDDGEVAK